MKMTSQNFPTTTNDEQTPIKDPRISTIVDKRIKGQTWGTIAKDLELTRRAIFDIRQKDEYTAYLVEYLYPKALKILEADLAKDKDYPRINAYKEIFKMIRALIPKQVESRNLNLSLSLEETRTNNAWIEHMTPQEYEDFKRLKDSACSRMSGPEK